MEDNKSWMRHVLAIFHQISTIWIVACTHKQTRTNPVQGFGFAGVLLTHAPNLSKSVESWWRYRSNRCAHQTLFIINSVINSTDPRDRGKKEPKNP